MEILFLVSPSLFLAEQMKDPCRSWGRQRSNISYDSCHMITSCLGLSIKRRCLTVSWFSWSWWYSTLYLSTTTSPPPSLLQSTLAAGKAVTVQTSSSVMLWWGDCWL